MDLRARTGKAWPTISTRQRGQRRATRCCRADVLPAAAAVVSVLKATSSSCLRQFWHAMWPHVPSTFGNSATSQQIGHTNTSRICFTTPCTKTRNTQHYLDLEIF